MALANEVVRATGDVCAAVEAVEAPWWEGLVFNWRLGVWDGSWSGRDGDDAEDFGRAGFGGCGAPGLI